MQLCSCASAPCPLRAQASHPVECASVHKHMFTSSFTQTTRTPTHVLMRACAHTQAHAKHSHTHVHKHTHTRRLLLSNKLSLSRHTHPHARAPCTRRFHHPPERARGHSEPVLTRGHEHTEPGSCNPRPHAGRGPHIHTAWLCEWGWHIIIVLPTPLHAP